MLRTAHGASQLVSGPLRKAMRGTAEKILLRGLHLGWKLGFGTQGTLDNQPTWSWVQAAKRTWIIPGPLPGDCIVVAVPVMVMIRAKRIRMIMRGGGGGAGAG